MINPIMGISAKHEGASSLADALFPKGRQRVLAVLFGNPGRSFYANEVIALAQSGTGAVQRELAALSEAGLLTVTKQGNQKHYQANASATVFAELRGLVLKTMGLADILKVRRAVERGGADGLHREADFEEGGLTGRCGHDRITQTDKHPCPYPGTKSNPVR
ncbi:MAG: winged helix-turn-helix domain-containing protein [Polaromonas sp.]|nr:winged helix-turn-helix domain-containing protein [Polaromonas sp.]